MKQILLFLLLAGQFVQALTQVNAPNRTDKEGLRTGEWVIYFQQDDQVTDNPSGATRYYLVNYKKGEPKGFTREYAIDGTLVWEGELRSVLPDTIHGVSRGFFRDGTVSYEYTFADGLMQGPAKQFYENGELKWSCNYTDDFPDGTYKEYYDNGNLMREGPVVKGKKNGYFRFYFIDGNMQKGVTYVNDVMDGPYDEYDNGKLKYHYAMANGLREGLVTQYDASGQEENYYMFHADSVIGIKEVIGIVSSNLLPGMDQRLGLNMCLLMEEYFRKKYGEDSPLYPFAASSLAQYYFTLGDEQNGHHWTIRSYELEKAQMGTDQEASSDKWHLLGLMLESYAESDKAWECYRYAIRGSYEKGKPTETTVSYMSRAASMAVNLGHEQAGFEQFDALLLTCDTLGKDGAVVCTDAALNYISFLSAAFRDQDALHILESRRKIAKEAGSLNAWDLATADVIMQLNREDEAMDIYGRLYNNFTADRDTAQHIDIASSMAEYQMQSGNYAAAEKLWLETVALSAAISDEDSLDYYSRLDDLATYYDRVGRKFQAIQYSQQVFGFRLRMAKDTTSMEYIFFGDALTRELAVNSALSLGRLYTNVGMYDEAGSMFTYALDESLALHADTSFEYAYALEAMAGYQMDKEDFDASEHSYLEAIRLSDTYYADINVNGTTWKDNLSELYMRMHQPEKALVVAEQVLSDRQQQYPEGHPILTASYSRLSGILGALGQTDSALTLYEKVLDAEVARLNETFAVLSAAEQEDYLTTFRFDFDIYNDMVVRYAKPGSLHFQRMLNYQLLNRSLLLYSGTAARRSMEQHPDAAIRSMYQEWMETGLYLSGLAGRETDQEVPSSLIDSLQQRTEQLEKDLTLRTGQDITFVPSVTAHALSSALQEGECYVLFLRYPVFEEARVKHWELGALILNDTGNTMFVSIGKEATLEKLLENKEGESVQDRISRLYTFPELDEDSLLFQGDRVFATTWKPLMPFVQNSKRVYYTPAGIMNLVNLSAVPDKLDHFLFQQMELIQLAGPEAVVQRATESTLKSNATLTMIGGVQYDASDDALRSAVKGVETASTDIPLSAESSVITRGDNWKYLPGTLAEVQGIDRQIKETKWKVEEVTGTLATEELVRGFSGDHAPDILHIATHGFFLDNSQGDPLHRSGILLAGGNRSWQGDRPSGGLQDGIFTAAEVSYLDLHKTKLVVLSACETGLGAVDANEGVFGLQRGFALAGVDHTIMSLWKVSDKETALFMQTFYGQLAAGLSIQEAFARTRDSMSKRFAPYYWAAFVLQQ